MMNITHAELDYWQKLGWNKKLSEERMDIQLPNLENTSDEKWIMAGSDRTQKKQRKTRISQGDNEDSVIGDTRTVTYKHEHAGI